LQLLPIFPRLPWQGLSVLADLIADRGLKLELAARNLRPTFDELFEVLVVPVAAVGEVDE
jgi:hypothetical protein